MNNAIRSSKAVSLACFAGAMLAIPAPSLATLGESEHTVQADQLGMKATLRSSARAMGRYTMHQMETPAGTVVKEYVEPGGRIFAVSWQGPLMPDLRQLLGRHFETYVDSAPAARRGHTHAGVARPELVVRSQGRMRAFSGIAYIPGLVPEGLRPEDLR
jgi:hypothetical protein